MTEWRFNKRGNNTGWHTHDYMIVHYVVVPLFDGILQIKLPEGETVNAELKNGAPYYQGLGANHDVINGNDFECAFIEIEFLEQPER